MPLYDYHCQSCDHTFESSRKYDNRLDPEKEPCPECGKTELKYTISAPNICYSAKGSLKTTDSFNDRLKEIRKKIPKADGDRLSHNIR